MSKNLIVNSGSLEGELKCVSQVGESHGDASMQAFCSSVRGQILARISALAILAGVAGSGCTFDFERFREQPTGGQVGTGSTGGMNEGGTGGTKTTVSTGGMNEGGTGGTKTTVSTGGMNEGGPGGTGTTVSTGGMNEGGAGGTGTTVSTGGMNEGGAGGSGGGCADNLVVFDNMDEYVLRAYRGGCDEVNAIFSSYIDGAATFTTGSTEVCLKPDDIVVAQVKDAADNHSLEFESGVTPVQSEVRKISSGTPASYAEMNGFCAASTGYLPVIDTNPAATGFKFEGNPVTDPSDGFRIQL